MCFLKALRTSTERYNQSQYTWTVDYTTKMLSAQRKRATKTSTQTQCNHKFTSRNRFGLIQQRDAVAQLAVCSLRWCTNPALWAVKLGRRAILHWRRLCWRHMKSHNFSKQTNNEHFKRCSHLPTRIPRALSRAVISPMLHEFPKVQNIFSKSNSGVYAAKKKLDFKVDNQPREKSWVQNKYIHSRNWRTTKQLFFTCWTYCGWITWTNEEVSRWLVSATRVNRSSKWNENTFTRATELFLRGVRKAYMHATDPHKASPSPRRATNGHSERTCMSNFQLTPHTSVCKSWQIEILHIELQSSSKLL